MNTNASTPATAASADPRQTPVVAESERIRLIIGVLLALLLAAVDQASVAPAVAIIGADLGNTAFLSWVVAAYFVTATAVTTLYGKIADLYGRRPTLFCAIGCFIAGSLVSATAPDLTVLIIGRAIQGLGGGGLLVLAMTIIGDVVPPIERGRYAAYISGAWAVASIAGPVMGGAIAEHLHWRVIFLVSIPLGVFAVLMCNGPLSRLAWQRREHSLDIIGSILALSATVTFMLGLTWSGPQTGWTSSQTAGLFAASACLACIFGWRLRRVSEPLIPVKVLKNRTVAAASIGGFFVMGSYTGLTVFVPIYLQLVQGLSPSAAGFALIPYMAGAVIGSMITARTMAHVSRYKLGAVFGIAAAAAALGVLAATSHALDFVAVEALLLVIGIGLGTNFPVTTVATQNSVELRDLGAASGLLQFMRSLGSAIGLAALGAAAALAGIGASIAARGATVETAGIEVDASGFMPVFAIAALGAVAGFISLAFIEDKPLRGA